MNPTQNLIHSALYKAGVIPFGGGYGVMSVNEDLKVGFGVFSVSGAALDPRDDWSGRYSVQEIELLTLSFNPSVASRVNENFSLAVGAIAMFADLNYELAAPPRGSGQVDIDGDDWTFSYNFGALYEYSPETRFGLIYVSEIDPKFSGDLKLSAGGPGVGLSSELEFTFPQLVRFGGYHELNSEWAILGTVGWEDWSEFDSFTVSVAGGTGVLPTGWKDTYHFGGGLHYRPNDEWLFQYGVSYDTSPVDTKDRSAYLPMDRQIRVAFGTQYQWSEKLKIGGTVEYIDLGDARINDPDFLIGEYDTNRLVLLAATAAYEF